jgi:hypothetical protein
MPSRGPAPWTWRTSVAGAWTWHRTASRTTSSSSRLISSKITETSSPTASRTASHETREATAPCWPSTSTRRRWRNRCARSAGTSCWRQRWQARRCRSRWQSTALQTCCRSPARGWGTNQRRQIRHGRLRRIVYLRPKSENHDAQTRSGQRWVNSDKRRRVISRERRSNLPVLTIVGHARVEGQSFDLPISLACKRPANYTS